MSRIQQIADSQDWTDKTLLTLMLRYVEEINAGSPLEENFCEYLESCCEPDDEEDDDDDDEDEGESCIDCGTDLEGGDGYDGRCGDCADLAAHEEEVYENAYRLSREACVELLSTVSIESSDDEDIAILQEAVAINVLDSTIPFSEFETFCSKSEES